MIKFIFKDEEAYKKMDAPCYMPENDDVAYTGNDFLKICNMQPDIADDLFHAVDWQHPETLLEEWIRENEIVTCDQCGTLVRYGDGSCDKICHKCGNNIEKQVN